jgi:hypothetical protein
MEAIPREIIPNIILHVSYKLQSQVLAIVCKLWYNIIMPKIDINHITREFISKNKHVYMIHCNAEAFQLYTAYKDLTNPFYKPLFFYNQVFRTAIMNSMRGRFGQRVLLDRILIDLSNIIDSRDVMLPRTSPLGVMEISEVDFHRLFGE